MVLTVQRAHEAIEDVLAGEPSQAPNQIINDAGRWLVMSRKWKFLEGALAYLDFTKNQPYVELPADFRDIIDINRPSGFTSSFELVSHLYMSDLRAVTPTLGTFKYWGHIAHRQKGSTSTLTHHATTNVTDGVTVTINGKEYTFKTTLGTTDGHVQIDSGGSTTTTADNLAAAINQTGTGGTEYSSETTRHTTVSAKRTSSTVITFEALTGGETGDSYTNSDTLPAQWTLAATFSGGGGAPTKRLDIYPTPTADETDALLIYYRSGWATVTNDTTFVSVPEEMEMVLLEAVRAVADGYEKAGQGDPGITSKFLEGVKYGQPYRDAVDWDATTQPTIGVLKNGIGQTRASSRHLDTMSLGGPA